MSFRRRVALVVVPLVLVGVGLTQVATASAWSSNTSSSSNTCNINTDNSKLNKTRLQSKVTCLQSHLQDAQDALDSRDTVSSDNNCNCNSASSDNTDSVSCDSSCSATNDNTSCNSSCSDGQSAGFNNGNGDNSSTEVADCEVTSDTWTTPSGNRALTYCDNSKNAAIYRNVDATGGQVNTMETTRSWFICYAYSGSKYMLWTLGDTTNNWGWMPAGYVAQSGWSDDTAPAGLRKCT